MVKNMTIYNPENIKLPNDELFLYDESNNRFGKREFLYDEELDQIISIEKTPQQLDSWQIGYLEKLGLNRENENLLIVRYDGNEQTFRPVIDGSADIKVGYGTGQATVEGETPLEPIEVSELPFGKIALCQLLQASPYLSRFKELDLLDFR